MEKRNARVKLVVILAFLYSTWFKSNILQHLILAAGYCHRTYGMFQPGRSTAKTQMEERAHL